MRQLNTRLAEFEVGQKALMKKRSGGNFQKMTAVFLSMLLVWALAACNGGAAAGNPVSAPNTETVASDPSGTPNTEADADASAAPAQEAAEAAMITDREGKIITLPENVDKIISIAPSITETLIDLGLADKLVAIDKYSVGLDGVPENLPTYDIMAPDTESIAALKPDIIFATGMSKAKGDDPFKPVTDLGVLMTYIPSSSTIEGIKEDIRFIGQITGTIDKAEAIIENMETEIADILAQVAAAEKGKTVYFEIAAAPKIYSFGNGTFLNEMIEMLGAENVLADQESWVSVSEEVIIEKNPDIIFTNVDYLDNPADEIMSRNGWDAIAAVKNKQVYQVAKNPSSCPNEHITIALREMARALYPEIFQ